MDFQCQPLTHTVRVKAGTRLTGGRGGGAEVVLYRRLGGDGAGKVVGGGGRADSLRRPGYAINNS